MCPSRNSLPMSAPNLLLAGGLDVTTDHVVDDRVADVAHAVEPRIAWRSRRRFAGRAHSGSVSPPRTMTGTLYFLNTSPRPAVALQDRDALGAVGLKYRFSSAMRLELADTLLTVQTGTNLPSTSTQLAISLERSRGIPRRAPSP